MQIETAEAEITSMHELGVSAWIGTTVVVGQEHFRGTLDLVRRSHPPSCMQAMHTAVRALHCRTAKREGTLV